MCETPKSPPGDYNAGVRSRFRFSRAVSRVKHLNPRQGITTAKARRGTQRQIDEDECETPKSPPGDYKRKGERLAKSGLLPFV